ncbi:MAG TPA: hypothetical protein VJ726_10975 [Candidatus Limnocylindria bacterium]|nr:hypothetical protein [Candidatus Limnocylindria bacterium]
MSDVVVVPRQKRASVWGTPAGIFVGVLVLALITFGTSVALLTRVGVVASPDDDDVIVTIAPTRAATAAPATIRVTAGPGLAERMDNGGYRVSFTWTLEGAREGDSALLRFSMGSRVVSEQRGTLDPNVFSASTGRFTVTTAQECTADGWTAEIVSIRNLTPVGEATSRAAGVTCR